MTRLVCALGLALALGCGDTPRDTPRPSPTPPPAAPTAPPQPAPSSDVIENVPTQPSTQEELEAVLEAADEGAEASATGLAAARTTTPASGARCVVVPDSGVTLWPSPGAAATARVGDGVVTAIHTSDGSHDELVLLSVTTRGRPIGRFPLSDATSTVVSRPPVVADLGGGRAGVASVDRAGKLLYVEASPGGGRGVERRVLASDADQRFSPAVAAFGAKRAVVYTRRGARPVVTMILLDAALATISTTDVTPEAGGAASPYFTTSSAGPVLTLVDPREGFSPIHRVPIDANGVASHGVVLRPVTGLVDPARIAVASARDVLHVAYVAYGSSQATAVGYFRATADAPQPVSLVRPTGFGGLWVEAATLPSTGLAVFAATAPTAREPTAPRAVHVRAATHAGLGEATTFTLEGGLSYPALAALPDETLVLTASSAADVSSVRLRCAP